MEITELREKLLGTFKDFDPKEANSIADYLLWAEMAGVKTQGMVKLVGNAPIQNVKPTGSIKVEKETGISQLINARNHLAIAVSQIAADAAISKAKENGIGIIGVHNFFTSDGSKAFYVEKIARAGLIGIFCNRSPSSVTGFGSIDPLFGTNPIGFGFPTNEEPLVFDMATSAMTFYGLLIAHAKGEKLPTNVAIDEDGNLTTDPSKALNGAILPFDRGFKGAGLGMVVEILAGPLVSAGWIDNKGQKLEWGALLIAINPNLLTDTDTFKNNCSDLIKKIKNSRKETGHQDIRLPGERARKEYNEALRSGFVEVDDAILQELKYI